MNDKKLTQQQQEEEEQQQQEDNPNARRRNRQYIDTSQHNVDHNDDGQIQDRSTTTTTTRTSLSTATTTTSMPTGPDLTTVQPDPSPTTAQPDSASSFKCTKCCLYFPTRDEEQRHVGFKCDAFSQFSHQSIVDHTLVADSYSLTKLQGMKQRLVYSQGNIFDKTPHFGRIKRLSSSILNHLKESKIGPNGLTNSNPTTPSKNPPPERSKKRLPTTTTTTTTINNQHKPKPPKHSEHLFEVKDVHEHARLLYQLIGQPLPPQTTSKHKTKEVFQQSRNILVSIAATSSSNKLYSEINKFGVRQPNKNELALRQSFIEKGLLHDEPSRIVVHNPICHPALVHPHPQITTVELLHSLVHVHAGVILRKIPPPPNLQEALTVIQSMFDYVDQILGYHDWVKNRKQWEKVMTLAILLNKQYPNDPQNQSIQWKKQLKVLRDQNESPSNHNVDPIAQLNKEGYQVPSTVEEATALSKTWFLGHPEATFLFYSLDQIPTSSKPIIEQDDLYLSNGNFFDLLLSSLLFPDFFAIQQAANDFHKIGSGHVEDEEEVDDDEEEEEYIPTSTKNKAITTSSRRRTPSRRKETTVVQQSSPPTTRSDTIQVRSAGPILRNFLSTLTHSIIKNITSYFQLQCYVVTLKRELFVRYNSLPTEPHIDAQWGIYQVMNVIAEAIENDKYENTTNNNEKVVDKKDNTKINTEQEIIAPICFLCKIDKFKELSIPSKIRHNPEPLIEFGRDFHMQQQIYTHRTCCRVFNSLFLILNTFTYLKEPDEDCPNLALGDFPPLNQYCGDLALRTILFPSNTPHSVTISPTSLSHTPSKRFTCDFRIVFVTPLGHEFLRSIEFEVETNCPGFSLKKIKQK